VLSYRSEEVLRSVKYPMREEELYEPIKAALEARFERRGNCTIWITSKKFPKEAKENLDPEALYILLKERTYPDLFGLVTPVSDSPPDYSRKTFVVEIKKGELAFKDLYQTKRYAELLNTEYAFLISQESFSIEGLNFLMSHQSMLKFFARNALERAFSA
jgi:hypothetical protein